MNTKVLVAYASKYGSTREIAETIAEDMRENGIMVDLSSADQVSALQDYNAVVLGSAIYVGNWPKSAVSFLKVNQETLKGIPVWLFSSGPSGEGDPVQLVDGVLYPQSLKSLIEEINPVDITIFHGDINLAKINAMEKWAIKNVVKKPFGDFRDWKSIEKWTSTVMNGMKKTGVIQ